MNRLEIALGILIFAATACLLMAAIIIAGHARADGLPRGLGHPEGDAVHWYDGGCCALKDCEPVEPGAIVQTPTGYAVKYLTSRGFIVDGFIPAGSSSIRPSKDAREHACSTPQRVICIYLPLST